MKKRLWKFTGENGTFQADGPGKVKTLYFPLCNQSIMGSITPELRGDIKTANSSFLLEPCTRASLRDSRTSRNFWIRTGKGRVYSLTGVSKDSPLHATDKTRVEAGLLWHKLVNENSVVGIKSEIVSFCPCTDEPAEIALIKITNISKKRIHFALTAAIPVYARSADNIRDHRHVTSLLNRVELGKYGITAVPTMIFDETGHKPNKKAYFVYGYDSLLKGPENIFPTAEEFLGEGSDLEMPKAVYGDLRPSRKNAEAYNGKEIMAGLRFSQATLNRGETRQFAVVMGIAENKSRAVEVFSRFNDFERIELSLKATSEHWQTLTNNFSVKTGNSDFDNWYKWVCVQPTLRKIYGCSFLPDFDYGKGGRGWRDLWQDALALCLTDENSAAEMIVNNFGGVRIDGSNATIIGKNNGEFIADRNNIGRVWMDHGAWPVITTFFYINQSGNLDILYKERSYFYDHLLSRSAEADEAWKAGTAKELKAHSGGIYKGSVLEHMLVQTLVQFFNVGPHNHIRLENADWNDGLDMAAQNGESVAFTSMYAYTLEILSELVSKLPDKEIKLIAELSILLDRANGSPIDYSSAGDKHILLKKYFDSVKKSADGSKIKIDKHLLAEDLAAKSNWLKQHINETEWLSEGFYNGYYNNDKQRCEGKIDGRTRMTLTAQVFPIMSSAAQNSRIESIISNVNKNLKDPKTGNIRLNTDFGSEQHSLGRAFSFAYGEKENGAFFNHMTVMYAYALLKRGFSSEGWKVLESIFKMSVDSGASLIYPSLPEYFNGEGRGMYCYLTGSASWYVLAVTTLLFGIRGEYGDLVIAPNLNKNLFGKQKMISTNIFFAGRKITVKFYKPADFSRFEIKALKLNGNTVEFTKPKNKAAIKRAAFLETADKEQNILEALFE